MAERKILGAAAAAVGGITLAASMSFAQSSESSNRAAIGSYPPDPSPSLVLDASPSLNHDFINKRPLEFLSIHVGSASQDSNDHSQEFIENAVNTLVDNAPNLTHITISTYLDYPDQIKMWADAIHARGKSLDLRSSGFNTWRGTFGEKATGTPKEHIKRMVAFINDNYELFGERDRFSATPDEASNHFADIYPSGVGTNEKTEKEYNDFAVDAAEAAREAFEANGVTGVEIVLVDNPAVMQSVTTDKTAQAQDWIGTDNYPDQNATSAKEAAKAMQSELDNYMVDVLDDRPWVITFGPGLNVEKLKQKVQRDMIEADLRVITSYDQVQGLTLYPMGVGWENNPILDFDEGIETWNPRLAMGVLEDIKVEPVVIVENPSPSPASSPSA